MTARHEWRHRHTDHALGIAFKDPQGFLLVQLHHHMGTRPQLAGLQYGPVLKLQLQGPLTRGDLASRLGTDHAELWLAAAQLITQLLGCARGCHLLQHTL